MPRSIVRALGAGLLGIAAIAAAAIAENEAQSVDLSASADGTIVLEARGASVTEIIESLSRTLDFEVAGDAPGKDVRISRSLKGSLNDVLATLLHDANYVLVNETGAPKRLVILAAAPAAAPSSPSSPSASPYAPMSVEQLREKEGELVNLEAQYEDMSAEARERIKPGLAKKYRDEATRYSREVATVRALMPR